MSERDRLLRRIATIDFAIVELHLYMDTHPDDESINSKLSEYEQKVLNSEMSMSKNMVR